MTSVAIPISQLDLERSIDEFEKLIGGLDSERFDFDKFRDILARKIQILQGIIQLWHKNWKKAERFLKVTLPRLIERQIALIKDDQELASKNTFKMSEILENVERNDTLIRSHLNQLDFNQKLYAQMVLASQKLETEERELKRELEANADPSNVNSLRARLNTLYQLLLGFKSYLINTKVWMIVRKKGVLFQRVQQEQELFTGIE